jgi:hypothetical protein
MNRQGRVNYHGMALLALIAGAAGLALHLMHDGELLAFMLSAAGLGGLVGGRPAYTEGERQQLSRSFQTAFEALLLCLMGAYAFVLAGGALPLLSEGVVFVNGHWPSLVIALMCLLLGLAGLRPAPAEETKGQSHENHA